MPKICVTINGKKVKTVAPLQEIKIKTDYAKCCNNRFRWVLSDGMTSKKRCFRHVFLTSGKKKITCIINDAMVVEKEITVEEYFEDVDPNAVTLTYKNLSNDSRVVTIVTFQKNVATMFEESAIAWRIVSLAHGEEAVVVVNKNVLVAFDGAHFIGAESGQKFSATDDDLAFLGVASSPSEIQVLNSGTGSIAAELYKNYKLVAQKSGLAPGQVATFQLKPTIWIGVVSPDVVEGQVLSGGILSDINTEMSLLGIKSADVIMTGGGAGPSATPFSFSFANVVFA